MKKTLKIGLASSLLTTTLGGFICLFGSLDGSIASNPQPKAATASSSPDSATGRDRTSLSTIEPVDTPIANAIATIVPYHWQGKLTVVLRVQNIPVLTFLDPTPGVTGSKTLAGATPPSENAVARAKAVAQHLNQLAQNPSFNAKQITAVWDKNLQSYAIKVDNQLLTTINPSTILPDSTQNPRTDTIQATNRLRRLMGNAAPIQTIAGGPSRPYPNAVQRVRSAVRAIRSGMASWYGPGFHGRLTANGERYNQHGMTAAHKTLPFGTRVRVTNLHNQQSVVVRINDRGPYARGRVIDLSAGAAKTIGVFSSGVAPVQLEVLGR